MKWYYCTYSKGALRKIRIVRNKVAVKPTGIVKRWRDEHTQVSIITAHAKMQFKLHGSRHFKCVTGWDGRVFSITWWFNRLEERMWAYSVPLMHVPAPNDPIKFLSSFATPFSVQSPSLTRYEEVSPLYRNHHLTHIVGTDRRYADGPEKKKIFACAWRFVKWIGRWPSFSEACTEIFNQIFLSSVSLELIEWAIDFYYLSKSATWLVN